MDENLSVGQFKESLVSSVLAFVSLWPPWVHYDLLQSFGYVIKESAMYKGGGGRIGRREKWPKKSWEEGEIGGKSREEGEKET